ncbi:type II toxin-antitoxin system HicA family toxin [Parafrankia discariae]|uniref:type II toxin-antitoxin system HicA family toxin n=1 Tax=Parafrankia discariae TaxID=365528 RepID=UPI0003AAFF10|nr:type II toxin-antitoxin system HicA family toxin [Parafrankia discariae]
MTPALPRVSGAKVVKALGCAGFEEVATRGSHCKLRHKENARVVIVPLHRELATGTLASVLRQAGIDAEELRTLLT